MCPGACSALKHYTVENGWPRGFEPTLPTGGDEWQQPPMSHKTFKRQSVNLQTGNHQDEPRSNEESTAQG